MMEKLTVDLETLRRYDRPGPRYTSYPTAVEFHDGVGEREYSEALLQMDERAPDAPLSLYLHLPFCESRCLFCACNTVITRQQDPPARYLRTLKREIELVASRFRGRRRVSQLHWGGGTPTYYGPAQLEELYSHISKYFEIEEDAEIAVEIDPCVTTRKHLESLAAMGFNRLSLGVQDFTPEVQEAIERRQSYEETREMIEEIRNIGFSGGINLDLVYGLPLQGPETFRSSLERIIELRPDRIALYSFAFVPWLKAHQRRIDTSLLPTPEEKLKIYLEAYEGLQEAGYRAIGMDHFALPTDELSIASGEGRLFRNFMGYTVRPAEASLAFGMTGIGDLGAGFFQNFKRLSTYTAAVEAGRLPIERGVLLSGEDRLRQWVISRLMCNFFIDKEDFRRRFHQNFDEHFLSESERMREFFEAGFLQDSMESLRVVGKGRLFVRNIAMVFDQYREDSRSGRPVFSRTV